MTLKMIITFKVRIKKYIKDPLMDFKNHSTVDP